MVLITGGKGQLGSCLYDVFTNSGIEAFAPSHYEMDITDKERVYEILKNIHPEVVIHCAAYSNVENAEKNEEECFYTNVYGTKVISNICAEFGIHLIYISTDYVFDGYKNSPYEVDDKINPLSVYGKSKAEGEYIVHKANPHNAILRISWLFGHSGSNFVKSILTLIENQLSIKVVDDQIGSPTYTEDLAKLLIEMVNKKVSGIYHASNEGTCTWAEFAEKIILHTGKKITVKHISSNEYDSKVLRPKTSVLSKNSLDLAGLLRLPNWEDALDRFFEKMNRENINE